MFIKNGEAFEISRIEDTDACIPAVSEEILDKFKKFASNLKRVAPRAEDFLYFSAVMMHAAEAASLNEDGTPRLNGKGEPVKVGWDKSGGTWRWTSNDPNVKPYKNSNGDIFPEEELVKAHKKWILKPLCIDHKSSSVDHVRGFIVDTYYDRNLKRVVALCALDKQNYPDLARKVATGYSHSVSMGTAVGRAICTEEGCHRVARVESDFCQHMKNRSCYGEINVDLNPIELSIVVNGADPKAHIKHIIAAANTLNAYVDSKNQELQKLADNYTANISFTSGQPNKFMEEGKGAVTNIEVTSKNLETFRKDVDKAIDDFAKLQSSLSEEENNLKPGNDFASNQSSGSISMAEESPASNLGLAPPHNRYASADLGADSLSELKEVTAAIEAKLSQMKISLDKLANTTSINTQEENMSGSKDNINKSAYYQGTEEPTPGQPKYSKDPSNEKLRDGEDKQMVGQMDTGPVDGMHPGPDSVGMSELERKKMLARATAEERALRRTAIVNLAKEALEKKSYYQNTTDNKENPGTPTPGKQKYPVDKLNEQLREDSDKQMVGQKPFPGVGPVDGLHPSPSSADTSDELKRKELLRRADALRARFVRAYKEDGSSDLSSSAWEVFAGEKLLLTASVDELTGGRTDILGESIATKEFGTKLMNSVKAHGADKVRAMVKKAQVAPPPAAPPVEAAPPAGAEAPPAEDTGKSGDPKETASDLASKAVEIVSDLKEAVDTLTGEKAEMGEMGDMEGAAAPEMGATASFGTSTFNSLRKEINGALIHAMKESIATLRDHEQELNMIAGLYDKGAVTSANQEVVSAVVDDAFTEAKTAIADGFKLMTAFVRYARGTQAIVKSAEIESELKKLASEETTEKSMDSSNSDDNDLMNLVNDANDDVDGLDALLDVDSKDEEDLHEPTVEELLAEVEADKAHVDDNDVVEVNTPAAAAQVAKENPEVPVKLNTASKEGRALLRAKLAADALKTSPHLHEAHPKGGVTTELDVKPTGDLAKVEDLEEVQSAMLDLANAPPKVRKEAEAIHRLVSEGKLDPSDLDALVAEGLDKDAVSYWKKYYGQADGGSEFASELVKEHVKAEIEQEINTYKVKLARAYELAYDMVDRNLCHNDRIAISAQVDEIMKFNDDGFDTLKRVVARHAPGMRKEAGRMPQVGMIGSGEINSNAQPESSLLDQLSAAFATTSKRSF